MLDIRYVHLVYPYIIQCPSLCVNPCNPNMVCEDSHQTRVHDKPCAFFMGWRWKALASGHLAGSYEGWSETVYLSKKRFWSQEKDPSGVRSRALPYAVCRQHFFTNLLERRLGKVKCVSHNVWLLGDGVRSAEFYAQCGNACGLSIMAHTQERLGRGWTHPGKQL